MRGPHSNVPSFNKTDKWTFFLDIEVPPEDRFHCIKMQETISG